MNYFFRLCMQEADMIGVCIIRVLSKLRKWKKMKSDEYCIYLYEKAASSQS